jgi:hypothetical protein
VPLILNSTPSPTRTCAAWAWRLRNVSQTLTSIVLTPGDPSVAHSNTYQLAAVALDQFGNPMATQPSLTWAVTGGSGNGTVTSGGLYTAPSSGAGPFTVTATASSIAGSATVTVGTTASATSAPDDATEVLALDGGDGTAQIVWTPGDATADGYLSVLNWNSGAGGGVATGAILIGGQNQPQTGHHWYDFGTVGTYHTSQIDPTLRRRRFGLMGRWAPSRASAAASRLWPASGGKRGQISFTALSPSACRRESPRPSRGLRRRETSSPG